MAVRLTKRAVDAAKPDQGRVRFLFDDTVKGFGLRITPSGERAFIVQCRIGKGRAATKFRSTIGRPGSPWTVDTAREEAKRMILEAAARRDPRIEKYADGAMTVAELCDWYVRAAEAGEVRTRRGRAKKATTLYIDRGRIERHVKPLLGRRLVKDVTTDEIAQFMAAVASGKSAAIVRTKMRGVARVTGGEGTAARTVGLLQGIMGFAVAKHVRPDNPARGIRRPKDRKKDIVLDADGYKALGDALAAAEAEGKNRAAIAAARFLALTGMRKGEALSLRWSDVDAKRRIVRLPDSKTGESTRPLGRAAVALLESLPRTEGEEFVFPAARGGKPYAGLPRVFEGIRNVAELADVTLHTLRHSFATAANDIGYGEASIATLLGHARHGQTARYTHVIDASLLAAADRVSEYIDAAMRRNATREEGKIVVLHPAAVG